MTRFGYFIEDKTMAKFDKEAVAQNFAGYTPEEIQEYINILTSFLVDVLAQRGATAEELHAMRKQIVNDEVAFIDAEIARIENGG